jgi:tetratricopeptide (TPR) repeat protein
VDALVAAILAAASLGAAAHWAAPARAALAERESPVRRGTLSEQGARRLVTVVHLEVSTAAGTDEDDRVERAAAVLAAAQITLEDAGGLMVGRTPREILAVFGAIGSSGDEPDKAASAARAVVLAASEVPSLRARAGIDTGRVLVKGTSLSAPATVAGEPLEHAARLVSLAEAGEVRVSARTARHLRRRFLLEPRPGTEDFRLVGRRPADLLRAGPLPLVGREEVLRAVVDHLGAAVRDGAPRSVLVLGAPGIGKSRLRLEALELFASRGGFVLAQATAEPHESMASLALARALLRQIRGAGPSAEHRGMSPLAAARAAIAAAARARPLLLALDDAQWADDASLDLVEGLARGEIEAPLALLALARPELAERRPRLRPAFGLCVELGPLGPEQAQDLARAWMGDASTPEAARAIAEASEGNPFFVEELASDHAERGPEPHGETPSTLEAAIQARLDRLGEADRLVLRAAALLGRAFRRSDLEVLLGEAGGPERAELDGALQRLEGARLVFPQRPDARADDWHIFKHALIRDAAYGELPAALRRRLHAAAARLLEGEERRTGTEGLLETLIALARHREGAGEPKLARAAYEQAGDLAAAQGAMGDAFRCYERARELAGAAVEVELLLDLGETAVQVGAFAVAREVLDLAVARTEADPDRRTDAARALLQRATLAKQCGAWDEAVALCRRGLNLVDEERAAALAARLHSLLGWVLGYVQGDNEAGLPESLRAVELLGSTHDRPELARAYSALGANYMRAGQWRDQLQCNQRSLELGLEAGSLEQVARAHLNLGVNHLGLGDLELSAGHSRQAIATSERMCATALATIARNNLGLALTDLGRLDEAEREISEALRLAARCGGGYFEDEARMTLARIAAKRGDLESARARAEESARHAVAQAAPIDEGIARRVLGAILSRAGEHEAAARELDLAESLLRSADLGELARVRAERSRALARRGEALAAAVEREAARELLSRLGAAHDLARLEDLDWI